MVGTRLQMAALVVAAALLGSCSMPGGQGVVPGGSGSPSASASTGTESPAQQTTAPDAESSLPAPSPDPSTLPPTGPGAGQAELAITVTPAEGEPDLNYTLVCESGAPVAESAHPDPGKACAALKANPRVLAPATQDEDLVCTEQYGGPQKATVTGMVDGVPVDAAFARTNGCDISAWNAAADILGAGGA